MLRFILCLILTAPLCASFQNDYSKALEQAKEKHLPLLLFFNGSDWSGLGMKMKHEVLTAKAFVQKVDQEIVCVEIDFPRHHELPEEQVALNHRLLERFAIAQFPSLLLIDPEEREIARLGYLPETGEEFAASLLHLVEQDHTLKEMLLKVESLTSEELQSGYHMALELQQQGSIDRFLEVGTRSLEPAFFLVEQYRKLVEQRQGETAEADAIKSKLFKLDPNNEQGFLFTVALLDFQARSDPERCLAPDIVLKPLKDYLATFGAQDSDNVWRIEMMMAQFYLELDEWRAALEHAEVAYESAPASKQAEMDYSLKYIKEQAAQTARIEAQ